MKSKSILPLVVTSEITIIIFIVSNNGLFMKIRMKHDLLCINICWAPREVLMHSKSFQHLPRGPPDVNVSENHV